VSGTNLTAIYPQEFYGNLGFTKGDRLKVDPQYNIWIITQHSGIRVIKANTERWPTEDGFTTENSGLLSNIVYDIAFDEESGHAFIATDSGISIMHNLYGCTNPIACNYNSSTDFDDGSCEYPGEELDCDGNPLSIEQSFPTGFELMQNYPNPFNPITTIQYSLPGYIKIRIQVFDSNGGFVIELVNASIQPGHYSVDWNAANYASGIYFVRMVAGDYFQNQKLMLVK